MKFPAKYKQKLSVIHSKCKKRTNTDMTLTGLTVTTYSLGWTLAVCIETSVERLILFERYVIDTEYVSASAECELTDLLQSVQSSQLSAGFTLPL